MASLLPMAASSSPNSPSVLVAASLGNCSLSSPVSIGSLPGRVSLGRCSSFSLAVPARDDHTDELSRTVAAQMPLNSSFSKLRLPSLSNNAAIFSSHVAFGERDQNTFFRRPAVVVASASGAAVIVGQPHQDHSDRPRRIALFVEPSPFAYISGYKNRFQNFIKYLREMGDEVIVVTTHKDAPNEFHGAKVVPSWSFPCPWYKVVPLSLALSPRIVCEIAKFKPDIIHASSPGVMVLGALIIAKLLRVPLVLSYHTHVPLYIPKYTFSWLVKPMWLIIKLLHRAADLTLVTSNVLGRELKAAGAAAAYKIRLWHKGVDSDSFNPRFKSQEMRVRLTAGEVERPLIVHVGRLGAEKNLDFLVMVMEKIPEARLALVGDGPYRQELEKIFEGMPVVFTGMLHGEELSQAYASGDVFITPSESETLGFVVLEAMASGVPIIAARAGGIPDIIPANQEGQTGFLYAPGDIDDCVGKIKALLASPELCQRIGSAGRVEVEKHDWRAATKHVRNEEYNAAIWFWQRRRRQVFRWLTWCFRRTPVKGLELKV